MARSQSALSPLLGQKKWLFLGMIALFAVVAGTVLPNMVASPVALPASPVPNSKDNNAVLAYTPPTLPDGASPQTMITRLFVGTGVVLGICVLTLWLGKRWLVNPAKLNGTLQQMSLVETLSLGNRCCVHLLKVGDRPVLVGVDCAGVKTMIALQESFAEALTGLEEKESEPNQSEGEAQSSSPWQREYRQIGPSDLEGGLV